VISELRSAGRKLTNLLQYELINISTETATVPTLAIYLKWSIVKKKNWEFELTVAIYLMLVWQFQIKPPKKFFLVLGRCQCTPLKGILE
jgi:hypothetical protein